VEGLRGSIASAATVTGLGGEHVEHDGSPEFDRFQLVPPSALLEIPLESMV
jgi:hypothetical protein